MLPPLLFYITRGLCRVHRKDVPRPWVIIVVHRPNTHTADNQSLYYRPHSLRFTSNSIRPTARATGHSTHTYVFPAPILTVLSSSICTFTSHYSDDSLYGRATRWQLHSVVVWPPIDPVYVGKLPKSSHISPIFG